jgi:hypothetical protein
MVFPPAGCCAEIGPAGNASNATRRCSSARSLTVPPGIGLAIGTRFCGGVCPDPHELSEVYSAFALASAASAHQPSMRGRNIPIATHRLERRARPLMSRHPERSAGVILSAAKDLHGCRTQQSSS